MSHPNYVFINIPKELEESIQGYSGMTLFDHEEGVIYALIEDGRGWKLSNIEDCINKKAPPCSVVPISRDEEETKEENN